MRPRASLPTRPWTGCAHRVGAIAVAWALSLAILFSPAPAGAVTQDAPPTPYRLGIFPYMASRQTVEFFGPVAASMSRTLGRPVKLESVPSFADFTQAMSRQTYDIALIQPFDYPQVVEQSGYIPLARPGVPLVAQIFVRGDSRYKRIEDLRGTTLAMPPAEAAITRMALRALYDHKLIPGQDVQLRYFNSHDSCLQQVWVGNASACGSAPPPVSVFEQRMHASLRPIYSTPAIPHSVFVAHPRVSAADRARLQQLIIGWALTSEGRAILKGLGFPPFVTPKPAEYAMMRNYDPAARPFAVAKSTATQDLVLGVFPYFAPRKLAQNLAPILPALSQAAEAKVYLRTATSFSSFMAEVTAGSYDLILVQPFEFTKSIRSGYLPLAGIREPLQGSFFVRKQSLAMKITDLKGQVIAMPPAGSAMDHLGRHALAQAGLTPGRDVTISYRTTHDSCLREVQRGAAAACVTTRAALNVLPADLTGNLRAVGTTDTVPGVAFLAHQRLPANLRDRLQAEILSWNDSEKGRSHLTTLGFGTFVLLNPADYQKLSNFEALR